MFTYSKIIAFVAHITEQPLLSLIAECVSDEQQP